ncbi:MAG: calcineurin-like phosphoesterase family protein [Cypionkella sp.]|uniref:metallophosphoesterase family protein n=1 Tax=Cypionkella sp. TaxID=2811411 RepID=UPI002620E08C|nr:metallophosphoesterase [Cypionkella sp.]MDB5658512.1 calcineurin-like phosphoesterase family protein [Cypionkella sp.]
MLPAASYSVAVLADAHFHDPTGDFGGAGVVVDGARLALRSWSDTRTAARAFNETADALMAALQKIAALGVRHVILAGDYTDDGQAENTRRLVELLQRFEESHGLQFYAIPGNHDIFGPHGKDVTTRFVNAVGETVMVTSDPKQASREASAIHTAAMRCAGQPAGLMPMARFGLFYQQSYLHWESPFGADDQPAARMYDAVAADGSVTHRLMDASYLVEPEAGLWLLMIDANVFEPRSGRHDASRKKAFLGSSDAGWNALLRVKPFLLTWIADVTARAAALGKTLITVSHYPVLDPFQDVDGSELALFGETSIVRRTPSNEVAQVLIKAGLRWHLGGHMHVNSTTSMTTVDGRLTDLSLPSLVAFPSAFKLITASAKEVSAQTIELRDVAADPRIAAVYRAEGRLGDILPLGAFLDTQRRTHLLERRLINEWPHEVIALLNDRDASFLVDLAGGDIEAFTRQHGLAPEPIAGCTAIELIADAYMIKTAGPLAINWIAPDRLALCRALAAAFADACADPTQGPSAFLRRFLAVLKSALNRMDADDVVIVPAGAIQAAAGSSPAKPRRYPAAD